ncbi:MAG: peptide chain release factor-like protein [Candidatus Omnitrophica bacterium]|nr:peptide chain release factor-like protein [Candidatus Omnitrophota bacterium]MDE2222512.1 peptide chain release factor-like protein [Candidatus Omnitrophota bacterium]
MFKGLKRKTMGSASLSSEDVVESFVRSSGPGGQNVNKVATCVVLIHKPTGIIVKCQEFRTQSANRQRAWELLGQALEDREKQQTLFRKAQREKVRRQNRKRSLPAKERMLQNKKRNALKKKNRRKPKDLE